MPCIDQLSQLTVRARLERMIIFSYVIFISCLIHSAKPQLQPEIIIMSQISVFLYVTIFKQLQINIESTTSAIVGLAVWIISV